MPGILMVGLLGVVTTYIFGTLLTANGNLKQLNLMALFGMILNIVLNVILIPRYLASGSAWASLVTQVLTAIAQLIIAVSMFKLIINWKYIGRLVLFVILFVVAGFFSRFFGNWFYGMISAGILVAFAVRLINLRDLIHIVMYN